MKPVNLRDHFSAYRVFIEGDGKSSEVEPEWLYEIRGKHGICYPFDEKTVKVAFFTPRVAKKFGIEMSKGDEVAKKFLVKDAKDVLRAIKAKRKKVLSPEQRAVLKERLAKARECRKK